MHEFITETHYIVLFTVSLGFDRLLYSDKLKNKDAANSDIFTSHYGGVKIPPVERWYSPDSV